MHYIVRSCFLRLGTASLIAKRFNIISLKYASKKSRQAEEAMERRYRESWTWTLAEDRKLWKTIRETFVL